MTVAQTWGTALQLGGVLIAVVSLIATYATYAPKGTFKQILLTPYWWVREHLHPGYHRSVPVRWSFVRARGPEADIRDYDLPADTREALDLLAAYVKEDRARMADVKNEVSEIGSNLERLDTNQEHVVRQGVREYALAGLWLTAVGLAITAVGIFLTFF